MVDPYVELEFAGSTAKSDVRTETFDPVWNQKLVLHGSFPSMARNFIIRVKDKLVIPKCTGLLVEYLDYMSVINDDSSELISLYALKAVKTQSHDYW